jgi:hypothetical protein
LELAADRQRPAIQTFKGARCYTDLPADLAADLKDDAAADEALNYIATYLQRLQGPATEEDIAAFEAKHPIGTQARLASAPVDNCDDR